MGVIALETRPVDGRVVRTFFLPLLELDAANALASFEACTFGACKVTDSA